MEPIPGELDEFMNFRNIGHESEIGWGECDAAFSL